jgi:hypothetical protein
LGPVAFLLRQAHFREGQDVLVLDRLVDDLGDGVGVAGDRAGPASLMGIDSIRQDLFLSRPAADAEARSLTSYCLMG